MKFKFKNIVLVSLLAVAGILAVGSALVDKGSNDNHVAEEVNASSSSTSLSLKSGEILYVNGQNTYFTDVDVVVCFIYNDGSDHEAWSEKISYQAYSDYRPVVLPQYGGNDVTFTKFIVCRYNKNKTPSSDRWDGVYNQTEDIPASSVSSKNCVKITGYSGSRINYTTETYTHYGVKSGDHIYIDVSSCPGWIDAASTDNTHITIFVTATNGNNTYIYLWGDNEIKNHEWPGKKIYEQGAWVYKNGSNQGVAAISIDRNEYKHMIINHNNGNQSNTYDFSNSSKYKGFYFRGNNVDVGEWNAGSDYSTNAKIGVYFTVSSAYSGDAWGVYRNGNNYTEAYARKVEGQSNKYLYEVLAPKQNGIDVIWNLVIIGRFKNSSGSPNWDDKLHQKADFNYTSALHSNNEFKVNGWTDAMYTCNDTITNLTRANYYGAYFLSQITCDGNGNRTYSDASGLTNAKNEYKKYLSDSIQYYLWETKVSEASGDCQRALDRYDYIFFFKRYYSLDDDTYDFINRHTSVNKTNYGINSFSPFSFMGVENNFSTIIIVIASSVALLSVTALSILVIRKRKSKEQ